MISTSLPELQVGKIVHQPNGAVKDFILEVLGPSHLKEVLQLQERVVTTLEDESLYYPSTEQIFSESLSGAGLIIGCWVEHQLVGFRSIWYPRQNPQNLGLEIGMQDSGELAKVAHLERSCVLPEYRGNRLQIIMTHHAIDLAMRSNYFRYLFSTVAPMNYPSIKDKFEANMVILQLKKKYGDFYRYIFFQDILKPIKIPLKSDDTFSFINAEDITSQVNILDTRGDMVGCFLRKNNEMIQVAYAKNNSPFF